MRTVFTGDDEKLFFGAHFPGTYLPGVYLGVYFVILEYLYETCIYWFQVCAGFHIYVETRRENRSLQPWPLCLTRRSSTVLLKLKTVQYMVGFPGTWLGSWLVYIPGKGERCPLWLKLVAPWRLSQTFVSRWVDKMWTWGWTVSSYGDWWDLQIWPLWFSSRRSTH